eukprot:jgi/Hompol1/6616/HPOL_000966-RA
MLTAQPTATEETTTSEAPQVASSISCGSSKVQTESRGDILFIKSQLKTAVREALARRDAAIKSISDARTRILASQGAEAVAKRQATDKAVPKADVEGVKSEVERRLSK